MFQPYASSRIADRCSFTFGVSTLVGTGRFLYGMTKGVLNGTAYIVSKIARKDFGDRGDASIDGFRHAGVGLVEMIPLFPAVIMADKGMWKFYKIGKDQYEMMSIEIQWLGFKPNVLKKIGVYEGKLQCGEPKGEGIFTFEDGKVFEGYFSLLGQNVRGHGPGKMTYPDGSWRYGRWVMGQRLDAGIEVFPDGSSLQSLAFPNGFWWNEPSNQVIHYGFKFEEDGTIFSGMMKGQGGYGKPINKVIGAQLFPSGKAIFGKWSDNLPTGEWIEKTAKGNFFENILTNSGEVIRRKLNPSDDRVKRLKDKIKVIKSFNKEEEISDLRKLEDKIQSSVSWCHT